MNNTRNIIYIYFYGGGKIFFTTDFIIIKLSKFIHFLFGSITI